MPKFIHIASKRLFINLDHVTTIAQLDSGALVVELDYSVEDDHGYTIPVQYQISGKEADQLHEYLIGTLDALQDLVAPPPANIRWQECEISERGQQR